MIILAGLPILEVGVGIGITKRMVFRILCHTASLLFLVPSVTLHVIYHTCLLLSTERYEDMAGVRKTCNESHPDCAVIESHLDGFFVCGLS